MKLFKMYYIRRMTKAIDPEIRVKRGQLLETDLARNIIYVSFKNDPLGMSEFRKYLDRNDAQARINTLMYGILHEIGHIETYDEEIEDESYEKYVILTGLFQAEAINCADFQKMYMELPQEAAATAWAIDFVNFHPNFTKEMQAKIGSERSK